MLLWNFVNFLETEDAWVVKLIAILLSAALLTTLFKRILDRLHLRFQAKHQVWQDTFVRALCHPIRYYIWFAVLAHSVNLISNQLLSEHFIEEIKLTFSVLAVLTCAWFLLRWKKNLLAVLSEKQKTQEIVIDSDRILAFSKLATAAIVVITVLLLMEVTGQSFHTLIAFGGISGLALAIASQEIIGNFFGGMMIYVTRPFAVADLIRLPNSNLEGYVEDIGWYQTRLRAQDKKPVYIPNALFSKTYVVNDSRKTHRRLNEIISVRHKDLFLVPKIIKELRDYLRVNPGIDLAEKVMISIDSIGPYSVDILISALSNYTEEEEFLQLRDAIYLKIGEVIDKVGARIATSMHSLAHTIGRKEREEEEQEPFLRSRSEATE